jgi:hypothetical protein
MCTTKKFWSKNCSANLKIGEVPEKSVFWAKHVDVVNKRNFSKPRYPKLGGWGV